MEDFLVDEELAFRPRKQIRNSFTISSEKKENEKVQQKEDVPFNPTKDLPKPPNMVGEREDGYDPFVTRKEIRRTPQKKKPSSRGDNDSLLKRNDGHSYFKIQSTPAKRESLMSNIRESGLKNTFANFPKDEGDKSSQYLMSTPRMLQNSFALPGYKNVVPDDKKNKKKTYTKEEAEELEFAFGRKRELRRSPQWDTNTAQEAPAQQFAIPSPVKVKPEVIAVKRRKRHNNSKQQIRQVRKVPPPRISPQRAPERPSPSHKRSVGMTGPTMAKKGARLTNLDINIDDLMKMKEDEAFKTKKKILRTPPEKKRPIGILRKHIEAGTADSFYNEEVAKLPSESRDNPPITIASASKRNLNDLRGNASDPTRELPTVVKKVESKPTEPKNVDSSEKSSVKETVREQQIVQDQKKIEEINDKEKNVAIQETSDLGKVDTASKGVQIELIEKTRDDGLKNHKKSLQEAKPAPKIEEFVAEAAPVGVQITDEGRGHDELQEEENENEMHDNNEYLDLGADFDVSKGELKEMESICKDISKLKLGRGERGIILIGDKSDQKFERKVNLHTRVANPNVKSIKRMSERETMQRRQELFVSRQREMEKSNIFASNLVRRLFDN